MLSFMFFFSRRKSETLEAKENDIKANNFMSFPFSNLSIIIFQCLFYLLHKLHDHGFIRCHSSPVKFSEIFSKQVAKRGREFKANKLNIVEDKLI